MGQPLFKVKDHLLALLVAFVILQTVYQDHLPVIIDLKCRLMNPIDQIFLTVRHAQSHRQTDPVNLFPVRNSTAADSKPLADRRKRCKGFLSRLLPESFICFPAHRLRDLALRKHSHFLHDKF